MYPCSSLAGHFSSSFRPDGSFHLLDCPLQSLSVGQLSLETTQGKKKPAGPWNGSLLIQRPFHLRHICRRVRTSRLPPFLFGVPGLLAVPWSLVWFRNEDWHTHLKPSLASSSDVCGLVAIKAKFGQILMGFRRRRVVGGY